MTKAGRSGFDLAFHPAEARKAKAEAEIDAATRVDVRGAERLATVLPRALDTYRAMVGDLGKVLQRDMDRARAALRQLLGEIRLHPIDLGLEARFEVDWLQAIKIARPAEAGLAINLVAGTGFEPVTFGL